MTVAAAPAPDDSLARLIARGEHRRHGRGTILINEGEQGDFLFVIVSGRVKVYSVDERGREITYGVYGAGEMIGEMALDGGPRSASVVTIEPTVCAMITRTRLLYYIAEHPEFAFELLAKAIGRARVATRTARNMALLDVYGRLVTVLESLASDGPGGTRVIAERLTHDALSKRVGCTREMITRLMKDLRSGGYIAEGDAGWILSRHSLPARW